MALAETARLLAQYDFKDNSKAGIASATGGVKTLQGKVGGLHTALTKAGGAISTFGGRLRQLAGFGAGVLGIGGLLGFGKLLTDSIQKARDFGAASIRLAQLTQLPIEAMSRMVDALDFFGITADKQISIAGKFEKALGTLAEFSAAGAKKVAEWNKTHSKSITIAQKLALEYPKLAKFEKDYGLTVTDTKGKLLDYNAQLLASADFFNNKSIPAQKKAAALQKLYGRGWQDLIPILAQGRAGILKAEQEAMHLSQQDLDAITANKLATRQWTDALGDLETQIGIKLLPTLTEVLQGATGFIQSHSEDIKTFVMNAVGFAKGVVSTIAGVVEELGGLWDKIPKPLKDFISGPLLQLTIGEKAIKFLFGVSPLEIVTHGLKEVLQAGVEKGLISAGIGKFFVQPVFVTNPGFGLGGAAAAGEAAVAGEAAGGAAAAGGLGLVTGGLALIGVAGIELLIADVIGKGLRTAVQGNEGPLAQNHVIAEFGPVQFGVFQSLKQEMDANRKASEQTAINTSGSPDERNDAHIIAHHIAALNNRHARLLANQEPTPSKEPHKDATATQQRLDAQKKLLSSLDDRTEQVKAHTDILKQATVSKVGDLQRTTSSGTSQVVSAIQRNRPIVNVSVSVVDTKVTVTQNYQSGSNVGQSGPKGSGE